MTHFQLAMMAAVVMASRALWAGGPCDSPPKRTGKKVCYYDDAQKKKMSVTTYVDGKEVGPALRYREDGSLESVASVKPVVGAYETEVKYYETGDVRAVEFKSANSTIGVEYKVSGKIHRVHCLPGVDGSYGYSLKECQPKASFNIAKWRPAKMRNK